MSKVDTLKQALVDLTPDVVAKLDDSELDNLEYLLQTKHSLVKHNKDIRIQANHKYHK